MKRILAIDCHDSVFSVAVSGGKEFVFTQTDEGSRHSELAMPRIDELLKKAGIKPCELDGVVCHEGPGSFTSLRIGYSIAKALALALSIPFAAVSAQNNGGAKELLEIAKEKKLFENDLSSYLFSGPRYGKSPV